MVAPYYSDDLVTIYHGDCREILPALGRFDLLLTDPPYGIGKDGQSQSTGGHGGRKAYRFLGWDRERPQADLFDLCLEHADAHIIWGGNYFADILPPGGKWLVWDKGQRISQSDCELAYTSLDGALRIYELNRASLKFDHAEHPTQKPIELIKWCIHQVEWARTILDPFAGSGTTGRAAKDLCRSAVLIEREEQYCEIAARRMLQEAFRFNEEDV